MVLQPVYIDLETWYREKTYLSTQVALLGLFLVVLQQTNCDYSANNLRLSRSDIYANIGHHNLVELQQKNLHYTRGFTSKRVTNGGTHLRGLAPGLHSTEETSQRCRGMGDTASNLTDQEIEVQTSRAASSLVMLLSAGPNKHKKKIRQRLSKRQQPLSLPSEKYQSNQTKTSTYKNGQCI